MKYENNININLKFPLLIRYEWNDFICKNKMKKNFFILQFFYF